MAKRSKSADTRLDQLLSQAKGKGAKQEDTTEDETLDDLSEVEEESESTGPFYKQLLESGFEVVEDHQAPLLKIIGLKIFLDEELAE